MENDIFGNRKRTEKPRKCHVFGRILFFLLNENLKFSGSFLCLENLSLFYFFRKSENLGKLDIFRYFLESEIYRKHRVLLLILKFSEEEITKFLLFFPLKKTSVYSIFSDIREFLKTPENLTMYRLSVQLKIKVKRT